MQLLASYASVRAVKVSRTTKTCSGGNQFLVVFFVVVGVVVGAVVDFCCCCWWDKTYESRQRVFCFGLGTLNTCGRQHQHPETRIHMICGVVTLQLRQTYSPPEALLLIGTSRSYMQVALDK